MPCCCFLSVGCFPKKEPVSRWFYAYVALLIAGQCALSLFPDWVTQRTIYLLVGGFFLALLFYEVRPWQAVFASGAFFTLIALVEVLAMFFLGGPPKPQFYYRGGGPGGFVFFFFKFIINSLPEPLSPFFSAEKEMLCVSYGCCRSLRFKSQVLLSVMWHSIMLRMSISRIIWSVLWRCFSL